jgi:hypothetical protein
LKRVFKGVGKLFINQEYIEVKEQMEVIILDGKVKESLIKYQDIMAESITENFSENIEVKRLPNSTNRNYQYSSSEGDFLEIKFEWCEEI